MGADGREQARTGGGRIHVADFITYPWIPRTHFLEFI